MRGYAGMYIINKWVMSYRYDLLQGWGGGGGLRCAISKRPPNNKPRSLNVNKNGIKYFHVHFFLKLNCVARVTVTCYMFY